MARCPPGHTGQPQALKGQSSVEECHLLLEANLERPARPLLLKEAPEGDRADISCQEGKGRAPGRCGCNREGPARALRQQASCGQMPSPRQVLIALVLGPSRPLHAHVAPFAQESPHARGWGHPPGHPAPPCPSTSPGPMAPSTAIPTLCRFGAPHSQPPVGPHLRALP